MTKGKLLKADSDDLRCEAKTIQTEWKRNKGVDLRCPYFVRIGINGKRLCTKHAQLEAMAMLFDQGKATEIQIPVQRHPFQHVQVMKT